MANAKMLTFGIVGILVVLAIGLVYMISQGGKEPPPAIIDTSGSGGVLNTCDSTTTPTLNIKAYDVDNVGTAIAEVGAYRKTGSNTWTNFTSGTGFSADVGATYDVVFVASDGAATDIAYGPFMTTDTVPCSETPEVEVARYNDEIETSLTAAFWNADGVAATAEVFVANQEQTVSLKLTAGSDEYFGNPTIPATSAISLTGQNKEYPNVVCMDLNSTVWDAPAWVKYNDIAMFTVGTPKRHAAVAGKIPYCYTAPVVTDSNMESNRYYMRLNSDDTTAPAVDDTAYIYAANFYINADDGKVYWGIEDEDGNAVGTDASDSVTLDFT